VVRALMPRQRKEPEPVLPGCNDRYCHSNAGNFGSLGARGYAQRLERWTLSDAAAPLRFHQ